MFLAASLGNGESDEGIAHGVVTCMPATQARYHSP
jgi:hypothetical protein